MNRDLILKGRVFKIVLVVILVVVAALVVAGRANSPGDLPGNQDSPGDLPGQADSPGDLPGYTDLPNDLGEYFPLDTGREWTYKIAIGLVEPVFYREIIWECTDGKERIYAGVGGYFAVISGIHKELPEEFFLKIKVKGPASEYLKGAELTIERDDIGVFFESERVVWAATAGGNFMAQQVVSYPLGSLGALWNAIRSGSSMRLLMIEIDTGLGMGVGDSPDILYFQGIETNLAGYKGKPCVHFQRIVRLSKADFPGFNKDFTEDMWWLKGTGLVRLEQKVEGITSMVWTLQ